MTKDNWSHYYTPKDVAKKILSLLPAQYLPTVAIDICAGSGNFLNAANEKWNNIKLVAVDIDLKNLDISNGNLNAMKFDALNYNLLEKKLQKYLSSDKILLANPPFGKYISEVDYLSNLDGFSDLKQEAAKFNRMELLMLISNISLLKKNDYFGAVLPENFFTSFHLKKFKELFCHYFDEIKISETLQSFDKSEVKTRCFLGRFKGSTSNTEDTVKDLRKKQFDNIILYRGIDNSKLLDQQQLNLLDDYAEVLHFNNLEGKSRTKKFIKNSENFERLLVEKDDLLILRVGRRSGSIFKYNENFKNKYISDYFYLMKNCAFDSTQLLNLEEKLKKKTIGLIIKYITKDELLKAIQEVSIEIK